MEKIRIPLFVVTVIFTAFIFHPAETVAAAQYNIIQLHQGVFSDDHLPTINNRGDILFFHHGCQFSVEGPPGEFTTYTETGKYQLYQPGSLTTLNVPSNYSDSYPYNYSHFPPLLLNDQGQFGYRITDYNDEGKYKVYFHDGSGADPQLLASGYSGNVQLNEQGQMAWTAYDENTNLQVYFFDNGTAAPITNYAYSPSPLGLADHVTMNDNGQVVWMDITYDSEAGAYMRNVRQYQDGNTTCLYSTTADVAGWQLQVNNLGQIVWGESNGYLSDIMLYDAGNVEKLPGGEGFLSSQVIYLQINHQGQVMWLGMKEGDTEYNIYLYSNGQTTRVTNYQAIAGWGGRFDLWQNWLTDAKTKFAPHMNNQGEIVWVTRVPNASNSNHWDMAVYVYSRGEITVLDSWTVDPTMMTAWGGQYSTGASFAQINDAGQVVWSRYSGPLFPDMTGRFKMYLATSLTFIDQTGVGLGALVESDEITVSGINEPADISISSCTSALCEYSINGVWTSISGTVNNGDTVQVRQTSSGSYSTTTDLTLNIGAASDTFHVTTIPIPTYTLSVTKVGTGSGSVTPGTGTLAWDSNTGTGTYDYNTSVSLTATPTPGSRFAGWSGFDSVSGNSCTVAITEAKTVTATFTESPSSTAELFGGGDVLVTDYNDNAVYKVDFSVSPPSKILMSGALTVEPTSLTVDGEGDLIVRVANPAGGQRLIKIDHVTGQESIFASGNDNIFSLADVAVDAQGNIIAVGGKSQGVGDTPAYVIKIDPVTGIQTTITAAPVSKLLTPKSVSVSPNGDIIVLNRNTLDFSHSIVKVDPAGDQGVPGSAQTWLTFGEDRLFDAQHVEVEASGNIIVSAQTGSTFGSIFRVDQAGDQGGIPGSVISLVTGGGTKLFYPRGIAIDLSGRIIVPSGASYPECPSRLLAVDPAGDQAVNGDSISSLTGNLFSTFTPDVVVVFSDTMPGLFSFNDQTGVQRNAPVVSNSITVTGINTATEISISLCTGTGAICEYSINGGPYVSVARTVLNGDTVSVRQTSSQSYATGTDLTLTIGGLSDTFSVTTLAYLDTDGDGIANDVDPDDDNDGMPDVWENAYGLNSFSDDSADDLDNDGFTNLEEHHAGTDPADPDSKPGAIPPAQGEVFLHYSFNDDFLDLSGNDNHGTLIDADQNSYFTAAPAAFGMAWHDPDPSDRIDFMTVFSPDAAQAWSVAFWYDILGGSSQPLFDSTPANNSFLLRADVLSGAFLKIAGQATVAWNTNLITQTAFNHYAIVADPAGIAGVDADGMPGLDRVALYVNGNLIAPDPGTDLTTGYATNIVVNSFGGGSAAVDGGVGTADELWVFQDQALTGAQISNLLSFNSIQDRGVTLADAILVLQMLAGMPVENVHSGADVNGDGKIGLAEVSYIFQKLSGLRQD